MREANGVVGHLQILVQMHFTTGPDAVVAVLVAGEILEDRLHLRAVRVSGIGLGHIPADVEMATGRGGAVPHKTVKVRMADVALKLLYLGSTWKGCLADLRVFELASTVLRHGVPETCRVGPRGHVVPVGVVRIG